MVGIKPNFSESNTQKNDSRPENKTTKIKSWVRDYTERHRKRKLRRVVRERVGSVSSYSSIESVWMTEQSVVAPERISAEESLVMEEIVDNSNQQIRVAKPEEELAPPRMQQNNVLHAASDAFTVAISSKD